MGWLADLRVGLVDLIDLAPEAVRPGLLVGLVLLLSWAFLRRRRTVWNAIVRAVATAVELVLGLLLLPELAVTTSRRTRSRPPPSWTATTSQVADRVLDWADASYRSHGQVKRTGKAPVRWVAVSLVVSVGVYVVLQERPTPELGDAALRIWDGWLLVRRWVQP